MSQLQLRFFLVSLALLFALSGLAGVMAGFGTAQAAFPTSTSFVVTNVNDSGPGSLRQAILDANANPGLDDIAFAIPGCTAATPCVISLSALLPVITNPVRIVGPGMDSLAIDANNAFRVVNVTNVPAVITGLTIQNGATTGRGAGIRAFGPLTVTHVRLSNNQAEDDGGGMYAAGHLTINDSQFVQNSSRFHGGGLYAESGLTIANSEFISNSAIYSGAGVYANGDFVLENSAFTGNRATSSGGGLFAKSGLVVENSTFSGNTAVSAHGGGLFANSGMVLVNSTFTGNSASGVGGGFYSQGVATLTGPIFTNNTAHSGGGLYADGDAQLSEAWFEDNESHDGGGVYTRADLTLTDVTFLSNTATHEGGGLAARSVSDDRLALALTRVHFISNTASTYIGGGIFAVTADLLIDSSAFTGNESGAGGGGLYLSEGDGLIVNTLFAHNKAVNHGAALLHEDLGTITVKHATIVGEAGNQTPGITLSGGSLLLENTIIAQHTTGVSNLYGVFHQDHNLFYQNDTDIDGSASGGANSITGDPKFVAPEHGDFHIGPGSAALASGSNVGVLVDFEGDSRPLGGGFDIGYDEAGQITNLAVTYTPSPTTTVQAPVLFTATIAGGSNVAYSWNFGNGAPAGSGNPVSHHYATPGLYLVTVTASNSYGSESISVEVTVIEGEVAPPEHKLYLPAVLK